MQSEINEQNKDQVCEINETMSKHGDKWKQTWLPWQPMKQSKYKRHLKINVGYIYTTTMSKRWEIWSFYVFRDGGQLCQNDHRSL